MGSIVGGHRPGGFLMLQILRHDIGPSLAEDIEHLATIDALVRDNDQSLVIAAHQSGEGHRAPSFPASRCSVADIPQAAPQPSGKIGFAIVSLMD
jgi:hypothetical protein